MSGGNTFKFKRFAVDQNGCAMKIGTDGVLLGAWCRINLEPNRTDPDLGPELESNRADNSDHSDRDKAILDIGTGTGVIALQLAQRTEGTNTKIEAVEIDPGACEAAKRNFEASEWADRLTLHCAPVQEFVAAMAMASSMARTSASQPIFDHIVSNPPYFSDSLTSSDTQRNVARHTQSLSYDDLMKCCFALLKPAGRISLIVPAGAETEKMIAAAAAHDFRPTRRTEVHSTARSGPKRTLLEFMRQSHIPEIPAVSPETPSASESDTLTIEGDGPGTFSTEYRALTRDFYLYF